LLDGHVKTSMERKERKRTMMGQKMLMKKKMRKRL
jgi:hypothetical protein